MRKDDLVKILKMNEARIEKATADAEKTCEKLKAEMNFGEHYNGIFYCEGCGEIVVTNEIFEVIDDGKKYNVCPTCALDFGYSICDNCGGIFKSADGLIGCEGDYCEACLK